MNASQLLAFAQGPSKVAEREIKKQQCQEAGQDGADRANLARFIRNIFTVTAEPDYQAEQQEEQAGDLMKQDVQHIPYGSQECASCGVGGTRPTVGAGAASDNPAGGTKLIDSLGFRHLIIV
jgi:hypothetical protein